MLKYVIKRLLYFIPTLIAISLITFVISINAPGDPVANMLDKSVGGGEGMAANMRANEDAYRIERHKLGLDLPLFYFYITNQSFPDTLHKIDKPQHRETLEDLSYQYGDWKYIAKYYNLIHQLKFSLFKIQATEENSKALTKARDEVTSLFFKSEEKEITNTVSQLQLHINKYPSIKNEVGGQFSELKNAMFAIIKNQDPYKKYIPKFVWFGTHNQYHIWLFGDKPWFGNAENTDWISAGFVRGDFGISYTDRRPVADVLWDAIPWTILITVLSMIVAYLVAVPVGIFTAINKDTLGERTTTGILFALYSLPNFWIATLLIIYLSGYLGWFPAAFSLGKLPETAPLWDRFWDTAHRIVLPVFCLAYPSLAFISRQMRGGMLDVINQDYIRTARAKGLSEKVVVWKHALRNSLIPIITLFANIFPVAISGSFVIEYIFSIPGAGMLMLNAINARNYPVVFTILMFTAILTLIGTLVADILYAAVDPRISFANKK